MGYQSLGIAVQVARDQDQRQGRCALEREYMNMYFPATAEFFDLVWTLVVLHTYSSIRMTFRGIGAMISSLVVAFQRVLGNDDNQRIERRGWWQIGLLHGKIQTYKFILRRRRTTYVECCTGREVISCWTAQRSRNKKQVCSRRIRWTLTLWLERVADSKWTRRCRSEWCIDRGAIPCGTAQP